MGYYLLVGFLLAFLLGKEHLYIIDRTKSNNKH